MQTQTAFSGGHFLPVGTESTEIDLFSAVRPQPSVAAGDVRHQLFDGSMAVFSNQQIPVVQQGMLVSDGVDLNQGGSLYRMHQRLKASRRQVNRGTRCLACKQRKKKCDGQRPCARCLTFGRSCEDSGTAPEPVVVSITAPMAQPQSYVYAMPDMGKPCHGTAERAILNKFIEFGWSDVEVTAMFTHLPPRLRGVLVRLSDLISPQENAVERPLLPAVDADDSWWKDSTVCAHLTQRYAFNGLSFALQMNHHQADLCGGHAEEVLARMCQAEFPMISSQYRVLCLHLEYFLCFLGRENSYVHVLPFLQYDLQGRFKRVLFERSRVTMFADGVVYSSVLITPAEYNRAVSVAPDSKGRFLDCSWSGDTFAAKADAIKEDESIEQMMRTLHGRQRLDQLTDRIERLFDLQQKVVA